MASLVIWSPNYAPEVLGIPPLVTEAAEWLAGRGHCVDVVTAFPNYPDRRIQREFRRVVWQSSVERDVRVHRSWLRVRPAESAIDKALYELTFASLSLPRVVRRARHSDVLVCVVPSLVAACYAVAIARLFRRRLVVWVQDLVLSAAGALDDVSPNLQRVLDSARVLERFVADAADLVISCSPGFRDYFARLGIDSAKLETVLNWATVEEYDPTPPRTNGERPTFLYAGNIGYTQGFETLLNAASLTREELVVDIVGGGNAHDQVVTAAAGIPNVRVRPPVSHSSVPALYKRADAGIVLQRRVIAGANLPSKIATYLASGRPVVASIDGDTPAARILRESGGAVLVEPESPQLLADAMRKLARDPKLRRQLGKNGREYAERRLAKQPTLERFEAAILG